MSIRSNWLLLSVAVLAVAACTTPVSHDELTAGSAQQTRVQLQETQAQIGRTLASLDTLLAAKPAELKTAYAEYAKDVDAIHAEQGRLQAEAGGMKQRSEAYFAQWQKSHERIDDEVSSDASEDRRQTIMDRFHRLQGSYREAQTVLQAFWSNLEQIRLAYANDLTSDRAAAMDMASVVKAARLNGDLLTRHIAQVQRQTISLAAVLSPPSTADNPAAWPSTVQ